MAHETTKLGKDKPNVLILTVVGRTLLSPPLQLREINGCARPLLTRHRHYVVVTATLRKDEKATYISTGSKLSRISKKKKTTGKTSLINFVFMFGDLIWDQFLRR